jgi:hypothetical protein
MSLKKKIIKIVTNGIVDAATGVGAVTGEAIARKLLEGKKDRKASDSEDTDAEV